MGGLSKMTRVKIDCDLWFWQMVVTVRVHEANLHWVVLVLEIDAWVC